MDAEGFTGVGYNIILLDDGWQAYNRNGVLPQPNVQRFPNGMSDLASYVMSKNYNRRAAFFTAFGPPIFKISFHSHSK